MHVRASRGWAIEAGQDVEQRALTRARGSDHADELATHDFKAGAIKRQEKLVVVRKGHAEAVDAERVLLGEGEQLTHVRSRSSGARTP